MRPKSAIYLAAMLMITAASCNKSNSDFLPTGGQLPTRYMTLRDSAFTPSVLSIAVGNSITFLNQGSIPRSIVSDDNSTIVTGPIQPGGSFFYKKDTTGVFGIHCVETPALRATIIITP